MDGVVVVEGRMDSVASQSSHSSGLLPGKPLSYADSEPATD